MKKANFISAQDVENLGVGNAESAFVDSTLMRGRVAEHLSQRRVMMLGVVNWRKVLFRMITAVVDTIVIVQSDGKLGDSDVDN
jgi:hypothetical protein